MKEEMEKGPVTQRLANRIRALREERGMTGAVMADRLSKFGRPFSVSGVGRIERAERRVDVDDLVAIASVLDVSVPELLNVNDTGAASGMVEIAPDNWVTHETFLATIGAHFSGTVDHGYGHRVQQAPTSDPGLSSESMILEIDKILAKLNEVRSVWASHDSREREPSRFREDDVDLMFDMPPAPGERDPGR